MFLIFGSGPVQGLLDDADPRHGIADLHVLGIALAVGFRILVAVGLADLKQVFLLQGKAAVKRYYRFPEFIQRFPAFEYAGNRELMTVLYVSVLSARPFCQAQAVRTMSSRL